MKVTSSRILGAVAVVAVVLAAAAEASAPAGRYTVASGTVFDTNTKLTWQQTGPSAQYSWSDALTYCQTLSLTGTGWRLPTVKELQTIVDYSQRYPAIDTTAFPAPAIIYWSSSPSASPGLDAWYVEFNTGGTFILFEGDTANVRCVR
jgi:hypothetical protein